MVTRLVEEEGVRGFKFHPTVQGFDPSQRIARFGLIEAWACRAVPYRHTSSFPSSPGTGCGSDCPPDAARSRCLRVPRPSIVLAPPSVPWRMRRSRCDTKPNLDRLPLDPKYSRLLSILQLDAPHRALRHDYPLLPLTVGCGTVAHGSEARCAARHPEVQRRPLLGRRLPNRRTFMPTTISCHPRAHRHRSGPAAYRTVTQEQFTLSRTPRTTTWSAMPARPGGPFGALSRTASSRCPSRAFWTACSTFGAVDKVNYGLASPFPPLRGGRGAGCGRPPRSVRRLRLPIAFDQRSRSRAVPSPRRRPGLYGSTRRASADRRPEVSDAPSWIGACLQSPLGHRQTASSPATRPARLPAFADARTVSPRCSVTSSSAGARRDLENPDLLGVFGGRTVGAAFSPVNTRCAGRMVQSSRQRRADAGSTTRSWRNACSRLRPYRHPHFVATFAGTADRPGPPGCRRGRDAPTRRLGHVLDPPRSFTPETAGKVAVLTAGTTSPGSRELLGRLDSSRPRRADYLPAFHWPPGMGRCPSSHGCHARAGRGFDPGRALSQIERHRVTSSAGCPTFQLMPTTPTVLDDLSRWRTPSRIRVRAGSCRAYETEAVVLTGLWHAQRRRARPPLPPT